MQHGDGPFYGGKVVIGNYSKPGPINPLLTSSTMSANLYPLLFNGLTRLDEDQNVLPDLAASWDISEDSLTYHFYLRKGVKFHDGKEVTAEDVIFTYNTGRQLEMPSLNRIEQVKVLDQHTVQVVLSAPSSRFLAYSATTFVLPRHRLEEGPIDSLPFNHHPIGTGPFKYAALIDSTRIVFTANEAYYTGRPYLDSVVVQTSLDQPKLLGQLMRQEIDVSPSLTPEDMKWVELDSSTFIVHSHLAPFYHMLVYNNTYPLFSDRKIRHAFSLAIDKKKVIDVALYGHGDIATGPFLPDSWAYNSEVSPVPYDPKKAIAILKQAGWKDTNEDGRLDRNGQSFKVELLIDTGNTTKERTALVIRQAFQEIGVEIQLIRISTTELLTRLKSGRYEMILAPYNTGYGPGLADFFWNSKNIGAYNRARYKNAHVDSLFQADLTAVSRIQKERIYREIHKTLAEDHPVTFLFFKKTFAAVNRRLAGVKNQRNNNLFQFVHTWHLQPLKPERR